MIDEGLTSKIWCEVKNVCDREDIVMSGVKLCKIKKLVERKEEEKKKKGKGREKERTRTRKARRCRKCKRLVNDSL